MFGAAMFVVWAAWSSCCRPGPAAVECGAFIGICHRGQMTCSQIVYRAAYIQLPISSAGAGSTSVFSYDGSFGFFFIMDERRSSAFGQESLRIQIGKDFEHLGDESGPAGLVAGSESGAVITVKVFVEQNVVAPVGVGLELLGAAKHRPA